MTPSVSDDDVRIAYHAVRAFSKLWDDDKKHERNYRGMRAVFRRWQPGTSISIEMRQYIWAHVVKHAKPQPDTALSEDDTQWNGFIDTLPLTSDETAQRIDYAATIAALYAVAGHPLFTPRQGGNAADATEETRKATTTLGAALFAAELSDLRLMRFATTPPEGRTEALHRLMRFLKSKGNTFEWSWEEIRRLLQFLFGSTTDAERSADTWARQFFAARSQKIREEKAETEKESV